MKQSARPIEDAAGKLFECACQAAAACTLFCVIELWFGFACAGAEKFFSTPAGSANSLLAAPEIPFTLSNLAMLFPMTIAASLLVAMICFAISLVLSILVGIPVHLSLVYFKVRNWAGYALTGTVVGSAFVFWWLTTGHFGESSIPGGPFVTPDLFMSGPIAALAFWWKLVRPDHSSVSFIK